MEHTRKPAGKRVAIIDDERDIREACAEFLLRRGYEITLLDEDSERFLEDMRAEKSASCDLVLIDYNLPGNRNGLEAAKEMRELMSNDTRIVLISADETIEDSVSRAGFQFVKKPFSLSAILPREVGDRVSQARRSSLG